MENNEKQTVLVTGGAGFIGSHTVVELLKRDFGVIVIDNFCNSKISVINRMKEITKKDFDFIRCDIRNLNDLEKVFKSHKIDVVMHFAALKSGADSIKNPKTYYENNVVGTENLIKAMEQYGVEKLIFSSSATVYGDSKNVPIKETEVIGKTLSFYGETKYLNELYLKEHSCKLKKIKTIVFRYFNPIGANPTGLIGEDSPDKVPNNLMLYVLKVAKRELPYLKIFGNDYDTPDGTGVRDFIHVVDLALGHIAAIDYLDKTKNRFEVFNLGTGKGHSVLELVHVFERINNVTIPYVIASRRPGDVEKSYACVDKANKQLNWYAEKTLDDCVQDAWCFANTNINN